TGGSLSFGTYTSGQSQALDGEGTINYANCPAGNLTIELDNGLNAQGTQRRMRSGNNYLSYELYKTNARTARWGTGSEGLTYSILVGGNGSVPVYGRILPNQLVPAGTYTDTVTITFRF
ncbi:MAG: spore coat U domain-containing protein, partial [Geminicoccaceae bacterium]|nr:spore coat U domain-containing protein [Geminicoccaceae bacterium]